MSSQDDTFDFDAISLRPVEYYNKDGNFDPMLFKSMLQCSFRLNKIMSNSIAYV